MAETRVVGDHVPTAYGAPMTVGDDMLVDGHEHAWIRPPAGAPPEHAIELSDEAMQAAALGAYADAAQEWDDQHRRGRAGPVDRDVSDATTSAMSDAIGDVMRGEVHATWTAGLIDCQPPSAGRDARRLAAISRLSGVAIACVTGFHLQRYYAEGRRPWDDAAAAADLFEREITEGLTEAPDRRAAAIKAAHSGNVSDDLLAWEAAVEAQRRTGACLLIHTERGAGAVDLLSWLVEQGVQPDRVYLCHMDKRPDLGLHHELAQAGALLGYDTFLRPKYEPDEHVWPLLAKMLELGSGASIALGLDLAGAELWRSPFEGPAAFASQVAARVTGDVADTAAQTGLLGSNVLRRLASTLPEGLIA